MKHFIIAAEIYLAGGCFWGTEHFLKQIRGVESTEVGYANSIINQPTYQQVCSGETNAAETVKVVYDPETVNLSLLLDLYFKTIDPTSLNRQGNDRGTQYRTGIYYTNKADIAIILNITPDHLDRYNYEMQNYVDAKFRILQNQTKDDAFIFWNDDPIIAREIAKRHPEATLYPFAETHENGMKGYTENNQVVIETANGTFTMEQDLLALTGTHNLYNSLASGIASKIVDIHDEKIRASLSDFTGVEHRLEKVLRVRGVDYINDSKATNVNSCWYALQSMTTPVVLILGGTDKGNDYSEIEELVSKKVHSLIFMGVDNTKLHAFFDGKVANIEDARSMEEAVAKAYKMAHKGDTVLLSPCCASFDLFKSYEDRGDQFKACVRNL